LVPGTFRTRDTPGVAASDAAVKREPTPVGALFEGAFRRYGANVLGYTLWSAGVGLIPLVTITVLRDWHDVLFAVVAAQSLAHFLLCAILTALVTGTLRTRIASAAVTATVCAAVTTAVFVVGGPLAIILYPLLVFGPIAAAVGDASALRAIPAGAMLALRDWARAFAVLLGLGVIAIFLWFAFLLTLLPIAGAVQQVLTLALTTLMFSPMAALVERNFYGDVTGRNVLPRSVSIDQRDRGKRRR
jgi:hypothetical protein